MSRIRIELKRRMVRFVGQGEENNPQRDKPSFVIARIRQLTETKQSLQLLVGKFVPLR
jgi:hypothetical protein